MRDGRAEHEVGPFYRIRSNEVMIGFHVDPAGVVGSGVESAGEEFTKDGVKFAKKFIKDGENFGINNGINEIQRQILNMMTQNPEIITDKIAESIGVIRRHIEVNIRQLKDLGALERTGGRKSGRWVVNM